MFECPRAMVSLHFMNACIGSAYQSPGHIKLSLKDTQIPNQPSKLLHRLRHRPTPLRHLLISIRALLTRRTLLCTPLPHRRRVLMIMTMLTLLPMLMMLIPFRTLRLPRSAFIRLAIALTLRRRRGIGIVFGGRLAYRAGFVVYAANYLAERISAPSPSQCD